MKIKINWINNFSLIPENDADKAILRNLSGKDLVVEEHTFLENNGNLEMYEFDLVEKVICS